MTDREKLIELILQGENEADKKGIANCQMYNLEKAKILAEYLLANGVIVPPCKVGDTVYYINRSYHIELKKDTIYEAKVVRIVTTSLGTSLVIQIRGEWGCIQQSNIDCIETPDVKDFYRTVFLTKEEAEEKLRELKKYDRQ